MDILQIIADELNVKYKQVENAVNLIDEENSIEEQGKLTDEIVNALQNAKILAEVEDIYRQYKQKKRTRATVAKERGLEPLSEALINQDNKVSIEEIAKKFIDPEKGVETVEDAIAGAKDIIAEKQHIKCILTLMKKLIEFQVIGF